MSVKIFNDAEIYKKMRENVLNGENFEKIAEKFSGEIYKAVKGITDLMTVCYPQNKCDVDITDFKNFFESVKAGKFLISESEISAVDAVEKILQEISGKKLLINICGDENKIEMLDTARATEKISKVAKDFIFGVTCGEEYKNKIFVIMIMEGI